MLAADIPGVVSWFKTCMYRNYSYYNIKLGDDMAINTMKKLHCIAIVIQI